jgi:hypothetical protein
MRYAGCGFRLCQGGPELPGSGRDEGDEKNQKYELGDFEGCFGLCWSEGVDGGNLLEELSDEDENVEVEGNHGGDDVSASPDSVEMTGIEGEGRNGERDQRENANDDPGSHLGVWKAKTGNAGQDSSDEEQAVPSGEQRAAKKAEEDQESRCDADKADNDMHGGVGRQAHSKNHVGLPLTCSRFASMVSLTIPENLNISQINL